MSFKKFAALSSQALYDLLPLLRLAVCFGMGLTLNLSTQAGVFECLFDCVLSDLECEHTLPKVFVAGFFMDVSSCFWSCLNFPKSDFS